MAKKHASHHLLFGILAFQNGCVDEDQFLNAMRKWLRDKEASLEQLLVESKALTPKDREMLLPMVHRHLEDHGGDASMSLAATNVFATVRQDLENFEDEDIDEVLVRVSQTLASHEFDPLMTEPTPSASPAYDASQRFRILRPFSAGGMGVVHVAEDTEIGDREVAFKGIRDKYADDPLSRQQFRVEAEITGGLEHPNIVPVYGLGADKTGRPFYAMRFIRGESMKDAIRDYYGDKPQIAWGREEAHEQTSSKQRRRYRFRRLLEKFIDVCEAIHYAHCRGVLHRDLKPGNVMLGRYNEVLVVDWGLAIFQPRDEDSKEATDEPTLHAPSADNKTGPKKGRPEGTPAYMAPEQAAGRVDQFGKHTDVYALGATLYCILTGSPPFATGSELKTTLSKVELGDFPRPAIVAPGVAKPLEAICLKAMATRPRDRYRSAQDLAKDVQRWLDDEAVSAWREPVTAKVARWMRHHQKTVAAIGVGLVATSLLGFQAYLAKQTETALKNEAIENYQVARRAVDQFYTEVSEEGLLSQPGMETKRQAMLKSAQTAYARFAENYGNDAEEELARTLFRQGVIAEVLDGKQGKPIDFYQHALSKQVSLMRSNLQIPEGVDIQLEGVEGLIAHVAKSSGLPSFGSAEFTNRFDLANTLNAIGRLLRNTDRSTARAAFEAALTIRQGLVAEKSDARSHRKLANTLMNLGKIDFKEGKKDAALSHIRASNLIRENSDYTDYEWKRDAAQGLANEGSLLEATAAILKYKDAIDIVNELLATPWNTELVQLRANLTQYLLRALQLNHDLEGAQNVLLDLVERNRLLSDSSPEVIDYKLSLSKSLIWLGEFYYDRVELDDDAADWTLVRQPYTEAYQLLTNLDTNASRRDRAYVQKVFAKLDDREDEIDSAMEWLEQSLAAFSTLVEEDEANQNYKNELQDIIAFRQKLEGKQLLRDGKVEDAVQSFTAAIENYEQLLQQPAFKENKFKQWQLQNCKKLLADANSR